MPNDAVIFPTSSGTSSGGGSPTATDANASITTASFDYSSASPVVVKVTDDGEQIDKVRLTISQVFDGTVTLSVGVPGNGDILMETSDNDPYELGIYETWPEHFFASAVSINLYLSIAGSSQGSGIITLLTKEDK